ncbi:YaiO family outer membrane beta-barrel protein [Salinimicrobium oceani]|uniref:YaiO family outer membrane beta-barrel protein n=1 Tax=Salinimicrobium oceani TaxID=2722702 RepID=A0ABX1CTF0_9FLAO|nr:YaiO family outer membrane beta-barrel protein [Salinimicrobium oceani]NJW51559.1 YaiO family outer membrane beta-barrel protein [Salinimicrobium oceani]
MTKFKLLFFVCLFSSFVGHAQQLDTDKLYLQALQEYREARYSEALDLTKKGLEVAPDYHDIRILKVRTLFALQKFEAAGTDIDLLLANAPDYEGVKSIAMQRLNQLKGDMALKYNENLLNIYGSDPDMMIYKARLLLENGRFEDARVLASETYSASNLDDGQRYAIQQIMNLTVKDAVQVTGQYITFSDNYSRNNSWYALSAEYQHNFPHLALIGRATYSDRSYNDGSLYEIEAYPIFSDKMYAFANLGFSEGQIFPDYRASASLFYNFATSLEAEAGFRSLFYNDNSYFTAIAGLTAYTGKFYLNARAFIGPERLEQMVQNYQFNVRYYLSTPENYLFGRFGSGISPDEPTLYTRAQENPTLEARYFNAGINKTFGMHHVISFSGGILTEDLPREETGTQYTTSFSYRYKF